MQGPGTQKAIGSLTRYPKVGLAKSCEKGVSQWNRNAMERKKEGNDGVEDVRWQVGCHDALNELTSTSKAKGPINQARCETGRLMHKKGAIITNLRMSWWA